MDLKKTVKVKKAISGKSFRLIDFHIYNQSPEPESDDSGTDSYKPKTSKTFEPTNFVIQMFGINEKAKLVAYISTIINHSSIFALVMIGNKKIRLTYYVIFAEKLDDFIARLS